MITLFLDIRPSLVVMPGGDIASGMIAMMLIMPELAARYCATFISLAEHTEPPTTPPSEISVAG
jgi:hypothetical protein